MNDPYPTNAQLEAEAEADRLLGEQAYATARFRDIIRQAIADISRLYFPLGSPSADFDLDDMTGTMADFLLAPRDPQRLQDAANDSARDLLDAA